MKYSNKMLERFAIVIEVMQNGEIETYSGNVFAVSADKAITKFIENNNINQENIVYFHCSPGID